MFKEGQSSIGTQLRGQDQILASPGALGQPWRSSFWKSKACDKGSEKYSKNLLNNASDTSSAHHEPASRYMPTNKTKTISVVPENQTCCCSKNNDWDTNQSAVTCINQSQLNMVNSRCPQLKDGSFSPLFSIAIINNAQ
ncbi:Helicase MOV-10 [Manis javanica]|nr:Helicase MOV-10 [Manis javanica]